MEQEFFILKFTKQELDVITNGLGELRLRESYNVARSIEDQLNNIANENAIAIKNTMDNYQIPMTATHKSEMQIILNASQSQDAPPLRTIVNGATNNMVMNTDQINKFIVIINASSAQNKQELVNIVDPN